MEFGTLEFWEDKYTKDPEAYEWVQTWDTVKDLLSPYLKTDSKILNSGCGNSRKPQKFNSNP